MSTLRGRVWDRETSRPLEARVHVIPQKPPKNTTYGKLKVCVRAAR